MKTEEFTEIDKLVAKLAECDLGSWDRDFVDDMTKRLGQFGVDTRITGRQWEQLRRMERQYL